MHNRTDGHFIPEFCAILYTNVITVKVKFSKAACHMYAYDKFHYQIQNMLELTILGVTIKERDWQSRSVQSWEKNWSSIDLEGDSAVEKHVSPDEESSIEFNVKFLLRM